MGLGCVLLAAIGVDERIVGCRFGRELFHRIGEPWMGRDDDVAHERADLVDYCLKGCCAVSAGGTACEPEAVHRNPVGLLASTMFRQRFLS